MGILIPLFALAIPVLVIFFNGLHKAQRLRIEEARLRAGALPGGEEAFEELRAEVDQLRRELGEVHERLDFTERLLARNAGRDRFPGSRPAAPEEPPPGA